MPTIAIVEVMNSEDYEDAYGKPLDIDASLIVSTLPEWTVVTLEELEALEQLFRSYKKATGATRRQLLILQQHPVQEYASHSVQWWKELQETAVAEDLARKEAQLARSEERKAKRRARQLERDKAALKDLMKSNPDLIKELVEQNNEGDHSGVPLPAVETPSGKGSSRKRV